MQTVTPRFGQNLEPGVAFSACLGLLPAHHSSYVCETILYLPEAGHTEIKLTLVDLFRQKSHHKDDQITWDL